MSGIAEAAKKVAELSKKVESCKRELKTKKEYLDSAIRDGRDASSQRLNVKWASERLENAVRELERAQSEYNRLK